MMKYAPSQMKILLSVGMNTKTYQNLQAPAESVSQLLSDIPCLEPQIPETAVEIHLHFLWHSKKANVRRKLWTWLQKNEPNGHCEERLHNKNTLHI